MFSVLLVDDEPWDLLGMQKGFPWKDTGFSVIRKTTDPVEAFKIILNEVPDVVFTDIRMPGISGIDLIKMSRENNIGSEFVIVSGYSEFQYAQEVIKYSGYYYLLKPIDLSEAEDLLRKLANHLTRKRDANMKISNLELLYTKDDEEPCNDGYGEFQNNKYTYIPNDSFKELLKHLNVNYNKEVSLNELSEEFHLGTTYICDLFKEITGKTLIEYITDIRINKARELLKTTNLPIADVAEKIGYGDYYYFNKLFKKKTGTPPGKYRRGIKE